jgi:hypothetical protein
MIEDFICCHGLRGELSLLLQSALWHGLHELGLYERDALPFRVVPRHNVWPLRCDGEPRGYDVLMPSYDILQPSLT